MKQAEIQAVVAREILDSRGEPTVECEVTLSDGAIGIASVPSGASTGLHEAHELRDGEPGRYGGRGTRRAVTHVNERIAPALIGIPATDQVRADSVMIALDGSRNKSNLGANAILSVSLALARAAAASVGLPLYRYLGGACPHRMPMPMMNILNGGAHAANNVDVQEFMILPCGAESFHEGLRICAEVYRALRRGLIDSGLSVGVGDEGGFAPMLSSDAEALERIVAAITDAGYRPGEDVALALDVAASEWAEPGGYRLPKRGTRYSAEELADWLASLVSRFPIVSLEDGMGEEDTEGWRCLTERLRPQGVMLVGDDLFVTDPRRIADGIQQGIANAVLIKPNQIGTVSETCEAVATAATGGYRTILSHRSGETEDTSVADLSVALGTPYIKTGAPARGERIAKYNRLTCIERELFAPVFGIGRA